MPPPPGAMPRKVLGYPAERIVLFGESLGGAVAAQLAAARKPAALVLASTFTSVPDLGAESTPGCRSACWPASAMTRASAWQRSLSVLVIHSRQDDIIPFAHGERLFAAARPPKRFLEIEGGHNEGFVFNREAWVRGLDDFLRSALERKAAQTPASAVQ
jgi:fermentation-respiration switch protein FrsA (DUF1100 family)